MSPIAETKFPYVYQTIRILNVKVKRFADLADKEKNIHTSVCF